MRERNPLRYPLSHGPCVYKAVLVEGQLPTRRCDYARSMLLSVEFVQLIHEPTLGDRRSIRRFDDFESLGTQPSKQPPLVQEHEDWK